MTSTHKVLEKESNNQLPPIPIVNPVSLPPPPIVKDMNLRQLESTAKNWITQRKLVIRLMEDMIIELNDVHEKSSMARVGGRTGSLVGFGMATGGILLAVPTGGLSLLAVLPGLAVGGAGLVTSTGASIAEWSITKSRLRTIQAALEKDTALSNEVVQKARTLSEHDPECDRRLLFIGTAYVKVIDFVYAVSGNQHNTVKEKGGLSESTVKSGMVFGAKLLVGFNPIISVPLDLMLIADDLEQIKKKEPSELSEVLKPVVEDLKKQLKNALLDPTDL